MRPLPRVCEPHCSQKAHSNPESKLLTPQPPPHPRINEIQASGKPCDHCNGSYAGTGCTSCKLHRAETPAETAVRLAVHKKAVAVVKEAHPSWSGPRRFRTDVPQGLPAGAKGAANGARAGTAGARDNPWLSSCLSVELVGAAAQAREGLQLLDSCFNEMGMLVGAPVALEQREHLVRNTRTGVEGLILGGAMRQERVIAVFAAALARRPPQAHTGDFRDVDVNPPMRRRPGEVAVEIRHFCSTKSHTDGPRCTHAEKTPARNFLMRSHWSCCGLGEEDMPWCSGLTLPAAEPLPSGARVRLAAEGWLSPPDRRFLHASAADVLEGEDVGIVVSSEGAQGLDFLLSVEGHSRDIVCATEEALSLLQRAASAEEARQAGGGGAGGGGSSRGRSRWQRSSGGGGSSSDSSAAPPAAPPTASPACALADAQPSRETTSAGGRGEAGLSPFAPPTDLTYCAAAGVERRVPLPPNLGRSTLGPYFALIRTCLTAPPSTPHAYQYALVLLQHFAQLLAPWQKDSGGEDGAGGGAEHRKQRALRAPSLPLMPPPAQPAPPAPPALLACPFCTFENAPGARACEICESPLRPPTPVSAAIRSCPVCSFENEPSRARCAACRQQLTSPATTRTPLALRMGARSLRQRPGASISARRASRRAGWILELLSIEGVEMLAAALCLPHSDPAAGALHHCTEPLRASAAHIVGLLAAEEADRDLAAVAGWSRMWDVEVALSVAGGAALAPATEGAQQGQLPASAALRAARASRRCTEATSRAKAVLNRLWAQPAAAEAPLPASGGGGGGGTGGSISAVAAPLLSPAHTLALLFAATTAPLSDLAAVSAPAAGQAALGPAWQSLAEATRGAPRLEEPLPASAAALEAFGAAAAPAPWVRLTGAYAARKLPLPARLPGASGSVAPMQASVFRSDEEAIAAAIAASLAEAAPPAIPAPEVAAASEGGSVLPLAAEAAAAAAALPLLQQRAVQRLRAALYGEVVDIQRNDNSASHAGSWRERLGYSCSLQGSGGAFLFCVCVCVS